MRVSTYIRRTLVHHWRANLAVTLGVIAATATLTGALLVGDSMRGSLREMALRRLGPVEYALSSSRFFRETLATDITSDPAFDAKTCEICPIILVPGSISHASTEARANGIHVLGVDERFWNLGSPGPSSQPSTSDTSDRTVVLNTALADELGAKPGDDVLIRMKRESLIPAETLLGRREDTTLTLRLTVSRIADMDGLGGFGLRPDKRLPRNAFVPMGLLQRTAEQTGNVNTLLVARASAKADASGEEAVCAGLQTLLRKHMMLADYGLELRRDAAQRCLALETNRLLLELPIESATMKTAETMQLPTVPILTYLVNGITLRRGPQNESEHAGGSEDEDAASDDTIPYSTATAIRLNGEHVANLSLASGSPLPTLGDRDILLNTWAANDLGACVGDTIDLTYYVSGDFGKLDTVTNSFTLKGVVAMTGWGADSCLTPTFEGITDTQNLSDWDPPFPIDMHRLREQDEKYWDDHRATPKAFVGLETGQALWADAPERFGRLTSIRIVPPEGRNLEETAAAFEQKLLAPLDPAETGLVFEPVRAQALAAGHGSTDFGLMFIGFSFFLIVSAAVLVALIFRLGIEQRAAEVGMLMALGFSHSRTRHILLAEGLLLACMGAILGSFAALGYAWLMLAGLRSLWAAAVNAPFLTLHVSPLSLAIGFAISVLLAAIALSWALKGLCETSPNALLAGITQSGRIVLGKHKRLPGIIVTALAILAAVAMVATAISGGATSQAAAFFAGGAALLIACIAGLWIYLSVDHRRPIHTSGTVAMIRLGIRNAIRNRGRSLLTFTLVSAAAFVIIAVGANRKQHNPESHDRHTPTGGFSLLAEASVPLLHDLNTPEGAEALTLSGETAKALKAGTVVPFRLKGGDDASCLNLYSIQRPRILGVTNIAVSWGGFTFSDSLAQTPEEAENPWILLHRTFSDGAVPAIADYGTAIWLLHLGLGKDFEMTDERGRPVKLRIVGMTQGSILQGQLMIAENRFVDLFPSVGGYGFFLIDTPPDQADTLARDLEKDLDAYGFDVDRTDERLNEYMAVENTYLSTFQTLGGLGLLLGTLGLTAVMLRNVHERRGELALLRALGYSRSAMSWIILAENGSILVLGLAGGTLSALVAIGPHIATSAGSIPWHSLAATLAGVLVVGLCAGAIALVSALRAPLLASLRRE